MTNGGLYRVGPFVAVAGLLALLAGCGRFGVFEEREPWRAEAELQCLRSGAVKPSPVIQQLSAINGPGTCGIDHPFRVMAYAGGAVSVKQKLTLGCPMVSRADRWLEEVVQPAAQNNYGSSVVQIRSGSYSCRPRNNQRGAKLSEHSFGNAMDVFSFTFADGREVAVKSGWRGAPDEQQFLRDVFVASCQYFTTVLGPGADAFHYDHFHLDLARHDPRGLRSVCKPVIKHEPTPGEGRVDRPAIAYRAPAPAEPAIAAIGAGSTAGALAPRGMIPGGQTLPPQSYPRAAGVAPSPNFYPQSPQPRFAAPSAGSYPPQPRVAAARPVGAPMDLAPSPGVARPSRPPVAQESEPDEIDPNNDPYAADD